MMKKIYVLYRLIPAFVFSLMLFVPFVANLFCSNEELMDNRPLKDKPTQLDLDFSKNFEAYYNDTFAGRKKLVSKYIKLQQKLKIDTGQYFYGSHGWMFYDSIRVNNGNTMVDYYGEVRFSDEELHEMAEGINRVADLYASYGAKYVIAVIPNKERIYSEFMPQRMQKARVSEKSRMDVAIEYLKKNTRAGWVNMTESIMSGKEQFPQALYFKKDTHWTHLGGYLGFYALAQELNRMGYPLPLKPLNRTMVREKGKQHVDMHPEALETEYLVDYLPEVTPKCQLEKGEKYVSLCYAPHAPISQKVLVLGDSFAAGFMPFLSKGFTETVNAPAGNKKLSYYKNLMQKYRPQLVVDELIERYFPRFINYNRVFSGHYDD